MSKENTSDENQNKEEGIPEVEQELSKVATNPKKNLLILVAIAAVFIYVFYNLFLSSNDTKKNTATPLPTDVIKPVQVSTDSDVPSIPSLPSPPQLEDPTPPPPPFFDATQVVALPSLPAPTEKEKEPVKDITLPLPSPLAPSILLPTVSTNNEEAKKRQDAKRKSSIILLAGRAPQKTAEQLAEETDFQYRGDMNLVLGRGKLIDAIIESAINTDFGGEIRAIVTRDIYSEWGKNILIPKGSRVFGTYATGISGAYGRISAVWNRIDLASGYSLILSGTAVDNLGKPGLQGRVDNKFKERFTNAVLKSAFDILLANTLDSITPPPINSQTSATQSNTASSLNNIATSINAQAGSDDATLSSKFEQICAGVTAAITDKTSTAYTDINTSCNTLRIQTGATPQQKLTSLISAVNAAASTLLQVNNTNTVESQAQKASKQAFTEVSDSMKTMIEQNEFKPTITIDQGTAIKIYVNKDYKFPKASLGRSKVVK